MKDELVGTQKKPAWEAPEMVYVGKLKDLVQGGVGKTAGAFDSDPNGDQMPPGHKD